MLEKNEMKKKNQKKWVEQTSSKNKITPLACRKLKHFLCSFGSIPNSVAILDNWAVVIYGASRFFKHKKTEKKKRKRKVQQKKRRKKRTKMKLRARFVCLFSSFSLSSFVFLFLCIPFLFKMKLTTLYWEMYAYK